MLRISAALLLSCGLLALPAYAADKPKRFVCAPGTEQYGAPPPHGTNLWCRQPLPDGSFVRQGMYASFNRNGRMRIQGGYYNNKPHGVWNKYDRDGRRVATTVYYDGQAMQRFRYDENGKPVDLAKTDEVHKKRDESRKKQRGLNDWRNGKEYIPRSWSEKQP